jgi:shikimate kinase|tara:strand:+ start:45 stop:560 length:516 start_codon:yes stop_codon:yes gene_type:complete
MVLYKKNIVLIGMMGSGKSTIGHLLSKTIDLKFIDIDKAIEKETGLKIHNIFEKKGEVYFRNLEKKITLKFLKSERKIISLGGGGFLNKSIRKETLINNLSFWLNWKSTTIIKRIYKSRKRPLAFYSNENDLEKIIIERSKTYSEANFKINCENLTKYMIVNQIKNLYEKN